MLKKYDIYKDMLGHVAKYTVIEVCLSCHLYENFKSNRNVTDGLQAIIIIINNYPTITRMTEIVDSLKSAWLHRIGYKIKYIERPICGSILRSFVSLFLI